MPISPLKIGDVQLATNLLLAPIAGYCDVSFRLVARSFNGQSGGVGLACTDLICPEGVLRQNKRTLELAATCPEDHPLAIQLYGANADRLCHAAEWAETPVEENGGGAQIVDINMGCPVDKITKRDGGSKLLCDPDGTLRMVERIKASLKRVPLTCKLRLGWDDSSIVAPYLAHRLEEAGVSLITIHGRTTEMKFTGKARLDGIAEVVAAVQKIPVIGNGDIKTPLDARHMIDTTGCAGVMIGRGALARPWIFRDTWSYLTTGVIPPEPTLEEKLAMIRRHFYNICRFRDQRMAVLELRKRISWYSKTMQPCRPLKEPMREVNSPADFEAILNSFYDWRMQRQADILAGRLPAPADEDLAESPA
jgi:tRNA-dihydrouridine synthase B